MQMKPKTLWLGSRALCFLVFLFSGCATKTVYFHGEDEKEVNHERYRGTAPGLYAATKQNFLWVGGAATSDSEFGGFFLLWLPLNIADIPISLVSDSVMLAHPKTWRNQGRKETDGGWGPYVTYINEDYDMWFDSEAEFHEFVNVVREASGQGGLSGAAELAFHDFECTGCGREKEVEFKRFAEEEGCSQEQIVYVNRQYYSGFGYRVSLVESC